MATDGSEKKKSEFRNFGTYRGLQKEIPRPNIVRIETLDGNARERYLGQIQQIGDVVRKNAYPNIGNDKNDVFYGFIKNTGQQSYGISSNWEASSAGGGVLGTLKKSINTLASGTKKNRISAVVSVGAGLIDSAITAGESATDIAASLTGTNVKFTGSSSLKRYAGSGLSNGFNVNCGWYLPEQFLLCLRSLRILHRMTYPLQLDTDTLAKEMPKILSNVGKGFADAHGLEDT